MRANWKETEMRELYRQCQCLQKKVPSARRVSRCRNAATVEVKSTGLRYCSACAAWVGWGADDVRKLDADVTEGAQ